MTIKPPPPTPPTAAAADAADPRRYAVAADQVEKLLRRIAEINRRALRNVDDSDGDVVTVHRVGVTADGRVWLELQGTLPPLGHWDLVCVLHHDDTGTRVEPVRALTARENETLPDARGHCEACRTVRPRAKTFLLRDRRTGRTVQLGSSCVRAYTGADDPETALSKAQAIADAGVLLTSASRTAPPAADRRDGDGYVDTETFLAHAAAAVRRGRFVPASAPADGGTPTWQVAAATAAAATTAAEGRDIQRARDIRWWVADAAAQAQEDTYERRLGACLASDRLTPRELPQAASAVRAYNRHLAREIRARAAAPDPSGGGDPVDTLLFLALAAAAVRSSGFVGASQDATAPPTWRAALAALDGGEQPHGGDLQRAREIRVWAARAGKVGARDSYERKLAECVAAATVARRDLPAVAAAVRHYNQHLARVIAARRRRP